MKYLNKGENIEPASMLYPASLQLKLGQNHAFKIWNILDNRDVLIPFLLPRALHVRLQICSAAVNPLLPQHYSESADENVLSKASKRLCTLLFNLTEVSCSIIQNIFHASQSK